ncbi:MAG: hypothetical protein MJZ81_03385, partial [Bacteroidales bacterium]|nr:hypothetical protein [Bacteroidales bacterium]
MYTPLVPMLFPIFGAHLSGVKFQYPDQNWKEPCGMMANLVAESNENGGQPSDSKRSPLRRLLTARTQSEPPDTRLRG